MREICFLFSIFDQCSNAKVKLKLFLKDTCVLPNWGVIIKRRRFSCLLEEGIAKICKKFRFLHNVFNTDGIIIISKLTTYFIAQNRKTVKIKPVNVEKNEDCKGKLPMKKIVKTKKKSKLSNYKEMIPYCQNPTAKKHLNKAKKESEFEEAFFEKALSKVRPKFCFLGLQG